MGTQYRTVVTVGYEFNPEDLPEDLEDFVVDEPGEVLAWLSANPATFQIKPIFRMDHSLVHIGLNLPQEDDTNSGNVSCEGSMRVPTPHEMVLLRELGDDLVALGLIESPTPKIQVQLEIS